MSEIIKVSYLNWLSSAQKWEKIIEKVKAKEPFDDKRYGYKDLRIMFPCGYCREIEIFESCNICNFCFLYQTEFRSYPICSKYGLLSSIFGLFCSFMEEDPFDFKKALEYAEIILQAIIDDCPDKDQAIKDGIIFPAKKNCIAILRALYLFSKIQGFFNFLKHSIYIPQFYRIVE